MSDHKKFEKEVSAGSSLKDPVFFVLKEGFPFIAVPLAAGAALCLTAVLSQFPAAAGLACIVLGAIFIMFALFCVFFFRNPKISITRGQNIILSPCNGTVLEIEEKENEKVLRVFLSVFNVHLQRSPVDGKVTSVEHKAGKFLAAWNAEAHILNEQNIITIESAAGVFVVRQIAGFLARRCVARVKAGDTVKAGNMIGLIKFSSQVDLHLPPRMAVTVKPGDKVRAGVTIVGEIK